MPLSREELARYSRQLVVPEVGPAGQEKLKAAKVAVVGAGGLGNLVLYYLAGAGLGEIGVFDFGPVELSNLHRQPLYNTGDIGALKTGLAARRLKELNPGVRINARELMLTADNISAELAPYDYIADCTDNFLTRAAINRACFGLGKTYAHGAVFQFEGQLAVFSPRTGPCLECLCPGAGALENQACAEAGVLGPAAGAVASMQAMELLKLVLGLETLEGKFAMLDFRRGDFQVTEIKKARGCPVCGDSPGPREKFLASVAADLITPGELKARLDSGSPPRLLDLRHEWERGLCRIAGDAWMDFDALMKDGGGLDPGEDLVLYCKGQSKSKAAFRKLRGLGFTRVRVLAGGIDAWAENIEKGMTRY